MTAPAGLSQETLQRLASERRSHNVVEGLLLEVLLFLHRHERQTMNAFETLQASLASLQSDLAVVNAKLDAEISKTDALIALTDSIEAQLLALAESGALSPNDLSVLVGEIDAARTSVQAMGQKTDDEGAKVDAAIAADTPAPPAPAPAPEPPPASDPA